MMLSISICGTITLSQPDPIPEFESLPAPPLLSRDAEGPVFAEPWQAQAFALAVKLSEQGHFTWKEWAAALAEERDPRWIWYRVQQHDGHERAASFLLEAEPGQYDRSHSPPSPSR